MSVNINAYKTLFLKPDNQDRSVHVDTNNAVAFIFKPLDTTLEEVRLLFNIGTSSSEVLPPITYYMSICEVNQTSMVPLLSNVDVETLENQVSFSYNTTNTDVENSKAWLTFKSKTVFSSLTEELDLGKYYAIVIKSDAPSTDNSYLNNGLVYTEIPSHYNDNLKSTFTFNGTSWVEKKFNSNNIFACSLMYGGIVDETNELDLGSTSTSGLSSNRGYDIYLTLKNLEGSSNAENLTFTPNLVDTVVSSDAFKEESYLAAGKWLRFKPEYLPFNNTDFNANLYSTELGTTLKGGELVLLCQRDRVYPFPKSFLNTKNTNDYINSDSAITGSTELNIIDPVNTVYFSDTNSDLFVQKNSPYDFKNFNIKNTIGYRDANNNIIEFGSTSPIVNKYIKRFGSDNPISGFKITAHTNPNNITIRSNRKYPEIPNSLTADDTNNASFDKKDLSALTNYYIDTFEFKPKLPFLLNNAESRFYDSSLKKTSGSLYANRMFSLSGDDFSYEGNYLESPENRVPYFIADNILNETTKLGGAIDSFGFCLHSGRFSNHFSSIIVPETSDFEALSKAGLVDLNEYFSDKIKSTSLSNKAQGLLLVQHNSCHKNGKTKVNALIVKNIDKNGISTFGQCISSGSFDSCVEVVDTETYIDINIPFYSFTQEESDFFANNKFFFIPSPFANTQLGKGSVSCGFEIVSAEGHTLRVKGNISNFITVGDITEDSVTLETSTEEKSFYIAYLGDFISGTAGYGYGYAYGMGKFSSVPETDFFILFDDLSYNTNYEYQYGAGYGLFIGEGVVQADTSLNTWYGLVPSSVSYETYQHPESTYRNKLFMLETTPETYLDVNNSFYNSHNLKHILDLIDRSYDGSLMAVCTVQNADELSSTSFTRDKEAFKATFTELWNNIIEGNIPTGNIESTNYFSALYEAGRRCPEDNFFFYLFGTDNNDYVYNAASYEQFEDVFTFNKGRYPIGYSGDANPFGINSVDNTEAGRLFKVDGGNIVAVDPETELIYSYHYCKPIKIFPANTPNSSVSPFEKIAAMQGITAYRNAARQYLSENDPNVPEIDAYEGVYTYNQTNGNLLDLLSTLNSTEAISRDITSIRPDLKEYSLIVPFTISSHSSSIDACVNATKMPEIDSNVDRKFVDENNNLYEIFDHPYSLWSDRNLVFNSKKNQYERKQTTYNIYDYNLGPYKSENANVNNNNNYCTFNFYESATPEQILLNGRKTLAIDLGETSTYNNLSFTYKINYPENIDENSNTKVKVVVESSDSSSFNVNNPNTLVLFNGFIDKDNTIETTEFNNLVVNANSISLPDNFNLFILDLNNIFDSSNGRFIKISFEKAEDSEAVELSFSKLRLYEKEAKSVLASGYGYGNGSFDFFDVFATEGTQKGYFTTTLDTVAALPSYNYGYGFEYTSSDFIVPSIFGNVSSSETIINSTGAIFSYDNDYVVIDLGKELPVKQIDFDIFASNNISSLLFLSYKSFNYSDSSSERYLLSDSIIAEKVDADNFYQESIQCNIFTRLLIFKTKGTGVFTIKNLKLKIGSMLDLYTEADHNLEALNSEYSIYDEDIRTAPVKRVAKMYSSSNSSKNKYLGLKLNDSTPTPVTQISFSLYPDNNQVYNSEIGTNTYFRLQKTTSEISPLGISPTDLSWEDIGSTFSGKFYERLPQESKSFFSLQNNGVGLDGLYLVIEDPAIIMRASNNGFVDNGPYILRINTRNDLVFSILESYSDGQKAYIKLNANMREMGIKNNTEFYFERPTIISFPSTNATALQLIKESGAPVKINSLKVYTNLIDGAGNPVSPTSGDISWFMSINSN